MKVNQQPILGKQPYRMSIWVKKRKKRDMKKKKCGTHT